MERYSRNERALYRAYLELLSTAMRAAESEIWAWCLMPNHVHLIVTPSDEDGLRQGIANAHRRYAARINARNEWTGHLWQGRFGSVVMEEAHLYAAFVYVVLNPVRSRLVKRAEDWKWSSARAHLTGVDDGITTTGLLHARIDDFAAFLKRDPPEEDYQALRQSEIVGRPVADAALMDSLEARVGRPLRRAKPGRPRKSED